MPEGVDINTIQSPPAYRHDLDGLRGVAIALVVAFHIFGNRVSGGVDIFLLLSGYFFLGSQLRYASRPRPSLQPWWPVWRTLRRLVPTLVLVAGAIVAAAWWRFPAWWQPEMLRQAAASIVYFQNWELINQGQNYAVAAEDVSPFQHLWSMAVQGQFYLLAIAFALTLAAFFRHRQHLIFPVAGPLLIAATLASFAYSIYLGNLDQELNYYSTLSRMWQMTLGGVLAIYGRSLAWPRFVREPLVTAGIIMVVTTGMLFDGGAVFPGPAALYPIGGAVLIILAGTRPTWSGALLNTRLSQWLGSIAYPFYVWHWPLLIAATILTDSTRPTAWVGLVVLAISIVCADLTHRLVERPLRQRHARPLAGDTPWRTGFSRATTSAPAALRGVAGVVVAAAAVFLMALVPLTHQAERAIAEGQLNPVTYPGALALTGADVPAGVSPRPNPFGVREAYPLAWRTGCITYQHQPSTVRPTHTSPEFGSVPCVFGDTESDTTVYLVGGSHSEQYSTVLDLVGKDLGFKLVPLMRQGCPLHLGPGEGIYEEGCLDYNKRAIDHLLKVKPDLVITTSTRPVSGTAQGPDVVPSNYTKAFDKLSAAGIPLVGLRDNPWGFDEDFKAMNRTTCAAAEDSDASCGVNRDLVYAQRDPAAAQFTVDKARYSIDTSSWFCTEDFCPAVIGNLYVYRDSNHLSEAYTLTLRDALERELSLIMRELRL